MTGGRKRGGPRDGGAGSRLTPEDEALWHYAARTIAPISRRTGRVIRPADGPSPPDADARHPAPTAAVTTPPPVARRAPKATATIPRPAAAPPPLAEPDRRTLRRIRSGRIDIDTRIDLHGLTQSDAHARLRRFLVAAQADGCRWVLVITGKGGPGLAELGGSGRDHERHLDAGVGRGILRRNVPRWLAEPDLRNIVVGFREAAPNHGGEGALYVQLRTR
jgi:DNA-nicking Smr family endonuclease